MANLPADPVTLERALNNCKQDPQTWTVMLRDEALAMAAEIGRLGAMLATTVKCLTEEERENEQLRLDREQHAGNAREVVRLQAEVNRLMGLMPEHDTRESYRCTECGAFHLRPTANVPTVQAARPIARCNLCERVAANSMAGQRCYAEDLDGSKCIGTLFTVT